MLQMVLNGFTDGSSDLYYADSNTYEYYSRPTLQCLHANSANIRWWTVREADLAVNVVALGNIVHGWKLFEGYGSQKHLLWRLLIQCGLQYYLSLECWNICEYAFNAKIKEYQYKTKKPFTSWWGRWSCVVQHTSCPCSNPNAHADYSCSKNGVAANSILEWPRLRLQI